MDRLFLGIDTSNYKTSLAVTDDNGNIVYQRSEYLEVEQGERGLRQSVAFFMHSNALPLFIEEASKAVNFSRVTAVAVSTRPRRVEGSYMPVFLAGENAARELAAALNAPLYRFSHQEGHTHAVLTSTDADICEKCIMYHLSGGTSEILLCEADSSGYRLDIIGGTKDISIGQLIDRIGVKLGYAFPAGKYLDEIASKGSYQRKSSLKIKQNDGFFNLSGLETKLMRELDKPEGERDSSERIIQELFAAIAELIYTSADYLAHKYNIRKVYIAGGVASSRTVRMLISRLAGNDFEIVFGDPELSGDNAVGTARLGSRQYFNEKCNSNTIK